MCTLAQLRLGKRFVRGRELICFSSPGCAATFDLDSLNSETLFGMYDNELRLMSDFFAPEKKH